MPWYLFQWDPETEEHLAEHGVTSEEFEEVVCNPDAVGESRSTGRPIAFGYTCTGIQAWASTSLACTSCLTPTPSCP